MLLIRISRSLRSSSKPLETREMLSMLIGEPYGPFWNQNLHQVPYCPLPRFREVCKLNVRAGFCFKIEVLKGIEGTLEEVIERVEISELRASLDVLQSRVTALRVSIEPGAVRAVLNAPKGLS
jgi:hypothetical protein